MFIGSSKKRTRLFLYYITFTSFWSFCLFNLNSVKKHCDKPNSFLMLKVDNELWKVKKFWTSRPLFYRKLNFTIFSYEFPFVYNLIHFCKIWSFLHTIIDHNFSISIWWHSRIMPACKHVTGFWVTEYGVAWY